MSSEKPGMLRWSLLSPKDSCLCLLVSGSFLLCTRASSGSVDTQKLFAKIDREAEEAAIAEAVAAEEQGLHLRGLAYGLSERAPEFLSTLRAINKDWGRKKTHYLGHRH